MCMYGYCRISTKQQSIDRQIRNIKGSYDKAVIIQEVYTGTKQDRPEWNKLYKKAKVGDTIIFDGVSRMSRNADEGFCLYKELYNKGIESARLNGKQIGQKQGARLTTKRSIEAKKQIQKHSKDFNGTLSDADCMKLIGLARNTFYKYKRGSKAE